LTARTAGIGSLMVSIGVASNVLFLAAFQFSMTVRINSRPLMVSVPCRADVCPGLTSPFAGVVATGCDTGGRSTEMPAL
jgi:hypothetical protein